MIGAMTAKIEKTGWREALAVYADRRQLVILAMGFSSGLPLLLGFSTLSYWMAKEQVSLTAIGGMLAVSVPYSLKFLWAPVIDHASLPVLTRLLGRRRSWMLAIQCLLAVAIAALGAGDPRDGVGFIATMAFVVMSLGTIGSGLVLRRATTSGLSGPVLDAVGVLTIPVVLTVFAVELPFLQRLLDTVSLTQGQWLVSIALALVLPVVVDVGTDNEALRADPLYPGLARPRLRGAAYYAVMDEVVSALVSPPRVRWTRALKESLWTAATSSSSQPSRPPLRPSRRGLRSLKTPRRESSRPHRVHPRSQA